MMLSSEKRRRPIRPIFGVLHRWVGLLTAGFLFVCGLTGAVISWDHELDELLNPHLTEAPGQGAARSSLELAREVEARHPTYEVTFIPLAVEPGHSLSMFGAPRINPSTQRQYELDFNQTFVDPVSGRELGTRQWGAVWPITRETFVSFLYKLHFSLHLPEMFGTDRWGVWLLGVIALLWTLDCFVGFYLTLPARKRDKTVDAGGALALDDAAAEATSKSYWQRWKASWKVRWGGGAYRLNFDIHRAGGLWTWGLLLTIAFTAFSLNLYREVFFPMMSLVSDVTPSPFDLRKPTDMHSPITPSLRYEDVVPLASAEAQRRGWDPPPGYVFYAREWGIYGVAFFRPEDDHGAGGVGHRELYLDGHDGRVLGAREPWKGTVADIFVQAQFPLHSGRILGIPGRVLISLMGIVVAALSVTGVYVWWRKSRARERAARRVSSRPPAASGRRIAASR